MPDFAARPEGTGEFVDTRALAPDGEGRPSVTDWPFVETKDLIAGWYIIDVLWRNEMSFDGMSWQLVEEYQMVPTD